MCWACRSRTISEPCQPGLTRRAVLGGLAAAPVFPAAATAADTETARQALRDAAGSLHQLQSLIVAVNGAPLVAEALRGPALDRPVNVKSVSKVLVSALVGIAVERGELDGVDQPVAPLLSRWMPRRADPRVQQITVGDLLTMRSGLEPVSGAAYGAWVRGRHWIYDALSRPMIAEPGSQMLYSTASYHMLGTILSLAAGQDLWTLARTRLGDPLGIHIPEWGIDPQGRYVGGNDMRLSPHGLFAFGECCRNDGRHGGAQVIPAGWIGESWMPRTRSPETGHGYGYGWYAWTADGREVRYARGFGGQMILIAPAPGICAAITSDPGQPAGPEGHLGALLRLFETRILPLADTL